MAEGPAGLIRRSGEWSADHIKTLRFRVRIAPSDACRGHTRTRGESEDQGRLLIGGVHRLKKKSGPLLLPEDISAAHVGPALVT